MFGYIARHYLNEVAREPAAGSNEICLKSRQPVQKGFNRTGVAGICVSPQIWVPPTHIPRPGYMFPNTDITDYNAAVLVGSVSPG